MIFNNISFYSQWHIKLLGTKWNTLTLSNLVGKKAETSQCQKHMKKIATFLMHIKYSVLIALTGWAFMWVWYLYNQSPRITDFRYYLSAARCGYLSVYLSMYRCPFDCSHTIQPTAVKLWHYITHVYNSSRSFQIFEKLFFPQSYQSPRITDFRLLPKFGRMCLSVYV